MRFAGQVWAKDSRSTAEHVVFRWCEFRLELTRAAEKIALATLSTPGGHLCANGATGKEALANLGRELGAFSLLAANCESEFLGRSNETEKKGC